jgi:hypothetical protein
MRKAPVRTHRAARQQDALFNAAFAAARKLRAQGGQIRTHRAFARLKITPYVLAQAIVLPLLLCGVLWRWRQQLEAFWRACMTFWAVRLELALPLVPGLPAIETSALSRGAGTGMDAIAPFLILAATLVAFALSYRLRGAAYPLRFPLRIACVIQALSVLVFWFAPSLFPPDAAHHGEQLLTMGRALIFATPVMLGMGYYLMPQSLWKKLGYTGLILLLLVLMVPHQVVLHALILQKISLLFMPLLYFGFGAIFDALILVALYAWAASNVPVDTTG